MINEFFLASHVDPAEMDALWNDGWRHFGTYFFRYSSARHGGERCHVMPLRIDLARFKPSKSHTRILRKNRDLHVAIRETTNDSAKEALFDRHRKRFTENVPEALSDFLSPRPASVPCRNLEICAYLDDELLAFSFLDIGENATSAVYAAFEPTEHKRSLGIFTMLVAIGYSREIGARYYYPGYAYLESSFYDYKKRFSALERLDWESGWKPLER